MSLSVNLEVNIDVEAQEVRDKICSPVSKSLADVTSDTCRNCSIQRGIVKVCFFILSQLTPSSLHRKPRSGDLNGDSGCSFWSQSVLMNSSQVRYYTSIVLC